MDEANPNNGRFYRRSIRIADLELDPENPRISLRPGEDERRCIERLAHTEGDALLALCRDIAENGLGIDPIVVSPDGAEWLVRDGNRRVAALKLLNNPDEAPPELMPSVRRAKDLATLVPTEIECDVSDDEAAIIEHIGRQHRGAGRGEGLRQWEAVERALFELRYGLRGQDDLAAKLLRYASEQEIASIASNFPITTLTRFLSKERLEKIGFANIDNHPATLNQSRDTVHERLSQILRDLTSGRVNVKRQPEKEPDTFTMMDSDDQEAYLQELLEIGASQKHPPGAETSGGETSGPNGGRGGNDNTGQQGASGGPQGQQQGSGGGRATGKPSWERDYIAKPIKHHGIAEIPRDHQKARDAQSELTKISLKSAPMAAAILMRMLMELSVDNYIKEKALEAEARQEAIPNKPGLAHRMIASAKHMHQKGVLTAEQKDITIQATNKEQVSVHTLNKVVHSNYFFEGKESLNRFWDNLLPFLRSCWRS